MYRDHILEMDVVELHNHIIVLGLPSEVDTFLLPLVNEARENHTPPKCVLFVCEEEPDEGQIKIIKEHVHVYFIKCPALHPSSIEMAGIARCEQVVLFADATRNGSDDEPGLVDAGVIFATRFIRNKYPQKATQCVSEIVEDENIDFLQELRHKTGHTSRIYAQPLFAEGAVYSGSICTTLLVQAFYNRDILHLASSLISTNIRKIASTGSICPPPPGMLASKIIQIPLPEHLSGLTYQDMMHYLLQSKRQLPMGLYREYEDEHGVIQRFTYTNPRKETMLHRSDKVFILTGEIPSMHGGGGGRDEAFIVTPYEGGLVEWSQCCTGRSDEVFVGGRVARGVTEKYGISQVL
eukprot:CAMPEP_0206218872 /NCGR_PEP_ID=MMETSP0047_2-20121206/4024_1 /ASSEMBLY_ACC=CAM_ASM_000192 /TAXON_ID=195065 /ORGANISM="Chroomonas mesostigmatica_cf, Strain CCMP1168" /LENGTH=350 /DNA_ID=CAMNT_0053641391 /DNA_START=76 /DNA_END=1129 /DNA_ORIENTATION=+